MLKLASSPPSHTNIPQKASRRRHASRSLSLLFALNDCSSTPSLSSQTSFSRLPLPLYTSKGVHTTCAGALVARFLHIDPHSLDPATARPVIAPFSRTALDLSGQLISRKGAAQLLSQPRLHCIENVNRGRLCHGCTAAAARPRHQSSNIPNLGSFHLSSLDRP